MYSPTNINEEITKAKFGYYSYEAPSTHSLISVQCSNCHKIIDRQKRDSFRKHRCSSVEGNNKRCFRCGQWKDLSLFNKSPKLSGGVAKMCRNCYNNHEAVKKCETNRKERLRNCFAQNIELYFRKRYYALKTTCNRNNIPFNLTLEDINDLWNRQKGLCYYTNIIMEGTGKERGFQKWNAPSLDRQTPELGYVKGNVVWCCFAVNSFKQFLTEKQFSDKINEIEWWCKKS